MRPSSGPQARDAAWDARSTGHTPPVTAAPRAARDQSQAGMEQITPVDLRPPCATSFKQDFRMDLEELKQIPFAFKLRWPFQLSYRNTYAACTWPRSSRNHFWYIPQFGPV